MTWRFAGHLFLFDNFSFISTQDYKKVNIPTKKCIPSKLDSLFHVKKGGFFDYKSLSFSAFGQLDFLNFNLIGGIYMKGNHPKRRKDEFNPYTICKQDGKYYIAFRAGQSILHKIEKTLYDVFDCCKKI